MPVEVIETGVSVGATRGDQLRGDLADGADGREQHQRRVGGEAAPVDLASLQFTTATSRWFLVVSGMPAYVGTALTEETPGTISNPMPALVQACASSGPEA